MLKSELEAIPEKAALIVQAAVDAIFDKGLDQVKLTDVAKRAGVTTGAVTYYFEDKDALLLAAFHWCCGAHLDEMKRADRSSRIEPFLATLPTSPKRRRQWSVWLAFCVRAQTSKEMGRVYREHYAMAVTIVGEILEIGNPERALDVGGKILAAMDGVGLCAILNPQLWPQERQRATLESLLLPVVGDI